MNGDLQLRLKPFKRINKTEMRFFEYLVEELSIEASLGLESDYDTHIFVTVEEINLDDDDTAYMEADGYEFHVYLEERCQLGTVIDYLIHELAHVHSWRRADPNEDHCDEFGKSYALLYRKYLKLYDIFWQYA